MTASSRVKANLVSLRVLLIGDYFLNHRDS